MALLSKQLQSRAPAQPASLSPGTYKEEDQLHAPLLSTLLSCCVLNLPLPAHSDERSASSPVKDRRVEHEPDALSDSVSDTSMFSFTSDQSALEGKGNKNIIAFRAVAATLVCC